MVEMLFILSTRKLSFYFYFVSWRKTHELYLIFLFMI